MKQKSLKRIFKIITGVIIFFTVPSLALFGFMYFKYNEELPNGIQGDQADILGHKMLDALNYNAYKNTDYIEWTFKKRRHYKWEKLKNTCEVYWKKYKVILNLNDKMLSEVYVHRVKIDNDLAKELIETALKYFNNDSFWLVAPYTIFDAGTKRKLVTTNNNEKALLVTYNSGDSYLWLLEKTGKPKSFKMWTSQLPIDGIETSWSDWTQTDSGVQLPTFHKFLCFSMEITGITEVK